MLEQYPYANQASHVGHSLGGYLAKTMAIETQNDAIAFNAPDVRDDTNNIETIQEGQISTFNIVGDPLSAQIVNDIGEVYLVNASTVEGKLAQGIVLADDLDRTGLTKDTGSLFHLHGMLEIVNTFQNNEDNYVLGYEIAVNPESRLISVQLVDGHAITDALQLTGEVLSGFGQLMDSGFDILSGFEFSVYDSNSELIDSYTSRATLVFDTLLENVFGRAVTPEEHALFALENGLRETSVSDQRFYFSQEGDTISLPINVVNGAFGQDMGNTGTGDAGANDVISLARFSYDSSTGVKAAAGGAIIVNYLALNGTLHVYSGTGEALWYGTRANETFERYARAINSINSYRSGSDPIVFDLDNDGVELVSIENSNAYLDATGDGLFAERTGWVGADDGILSIDLNGNGQIDGFNELLENYDGLSALDNLAAYDTNADNVFDANDAQFADFTIWQDANGDGITDDGELQSLDAHGISSISLAGVAVDMEVEGNGVTHTVTFSYSDGSVGEGYNVGFDVNNANTRYLGEYDLLLETLFLPYLKGSGETAHLHIAASEDPEVLSLLKQIDELSFENISGASALVEQLMIKWSGVDGVDVNSRGDGINAQHLAVIESRLGTGGLFDDLSMLGLSHEMGENWNLLFEDTMMKLLTQNALKGIFGEVEYSFTTDSLTFETAMTLQDVLTKGQELQPVDALEAAYYWNVLGLTLKTYASDFGTTPEDVTQAIVEQIDALGFTGVDSLTSLGNFIAGTEGVDIIDDVIAGSTILTGDGNDDITGSLGDDVIISGNGDDVIAEAHGNNIIYTGEGNDTVDAGTGSDFISTGSGDDNVYAREENDTVYAGSGHDYVNGGFGDDTLYAEAGDDELDGGLDNDSLDGGEGNDSLYGGDGDDILFGGAGSDILEGDGSRFSSSSGTGNDHLDGGSGDDDIDAGDGDDIIIGGTGNDTLKGGFGSDTYHFNLGDGQDTIDNGDIENSGSIDRLVLGAGILPADVSFTLSGLDLLLSVGSDQITILNMASNNTGHMMEEFVFDDGTVMTGAEALEAALTIHGTSGADTLVGSDLSETYYGYEGNDTFVGREGDDTIYGGSGNDTVWGDSGGHDVIYGEAGDDHLEGGYGDDTIDGGEGSDDLYGYHGDDHLVGGAGDDLLRSDYSKLSRSYGSGNDTLEGGAGNDELRGYTGDDLYIGGTGNDTIEDTGGDDTYLFNLGDGQDTISDSAGASDTLTFGVDVDKYTVKFEHIGDNLVLSIDGTTDSITFTNWFNQYGPGYIVENITFTDGTVVTSTDVDTILADGGYLVDTSFANFIDGTEAGETLRGTVDNDQIQGFGGNDTIIGDLGADSLIGGAGNDSIYMDAMDSNIDGGEGMDTVYVQGVDGVSLDMTAANVEKAYGNEGDDTFDATGSTAATRIYGRAGNDVLTGGTLNDVFYGEDGDDVLTGNEGNDTLVGGLGSDTISGGAGNDAIYIDADDLSIDGGEGTDTAYVQGTAGVTLDMTASSIEKAYGNEGADSFNASGSTVATRVYGRAGNDVLTGGTLNDVFYGEDGNDTLVGNAGNDTLVGGLGADTLNGGEGNDAIYIDADDLSIDGGAGTDTAYVQGTVGTVLDMGASSIEKAYGNTGDDVLNASTATVGTRIYGRAGNDVLTGSTFNDVFYGEDGDDTLVGNAGNDTLVGGLGADTLSGGAGNDAIYIDADDLSVDGGDGTDTVYVQGTAGVTLDMTGSSIEKGYGNSGDDIFDASGSTVATRVYGRAGNDAITGGDLNDVFYGEDGDDTLTGGLGNDTLVGGSGADSIDGGEGNDAIYIDADDISIFGGAGTDTAYVQGTAGTSLDMGASSIEKAYGNTGNNVFNAVMLSVAARVYGRDGADELIGSAFNDVFYGENGDDILTGNDGDDTLVGGDGADILYGGIGNDALYIDADDGIVEGGAGTDTVYATGLTGVVLDMGVASVEKAYGNTGDDTFDASTLTEGSRVYGRDGHDSITGSNFNDVFYGEAGNDYLDGKEGNDTLIGGDGDDILVWDTADGNVNGGNGIDTLLALGGANVIDLSSNALHSLEKVDLTNASGDDEVILTAADILDLSDTNTITIDGEAGDKVTTIDAFTRGADSSVDGTTYANYSHSGASLLIEMGLSLNDEVISAL